MDKEVKEKLPEGITKEMITEAKQKYGEGKVKLIELPKDDDGNETVTVLATVPSRSVLGQFQRFQTVDPKKADEIMVKNCLLSHKEIVLADDGLFYAALNALGELIPIRKGIIKNC
jgi:hypothetical protein